MPKRTGIKKMEKGYEVILINSNRINSSDNNSEGLVLKDKSVLNVKYHPESSPGLHDSRYLFKQFREMIERNV